MNIRVTNFKTAREAIAHVGGKNMAAVLLNSKPAAVSRKDAERMEAAGKRWADYVYLFRDGRWLCRRSREDEDWHELEMR